MKSNWTKLVLNGILVLLIQVVFINNINFWGTFNPKIYPIFLLLFPRVIKPSQFMTLGLIYGFLVDTFSQTYGIGMASSVFICFLRPYIFRILSNRKDEDELEIVNKFKDRAFLIRLLVISLLIFHLTYFVIEMGELYNPFYIIWKAILSAFLAVAFYLLYNVIFRSNYGKKIKGYSYK